MGVLYEEYKTEKLKSDTHLNLDFRLFTNSSKFNLDNNCRILLDSKHKLGASLQPVESLQVVRLECWNVGKMGPDCVTCSALRVTGQRLRAWNLMIRILVVNLLFLVQRNFLASL